MKNIINKLYSFIARIVFLLEEELNQIQSAESKNALSVKKNITSILNKLVSLIIQLNKLSKEEIEEESEISENDQEIIKSFIQKYNFQKNNIPKD